MANTYKTTSQKINEIGNKLSRHDKEIDEQKSITKFFIIVVAATLISTLVSLAGLYISAFEKSMSSANTDDEIRNLILKLDDTQKEMSDNNLKIELIKARNPYLK